jgi:hypothetical protein
MRASFVGSVLGTMRTYFGVESLGRVPGEAY